MIYALICACRSIRAHPWRNALLICCLALTIACPLTLFVLGKHYQQQMQARTQQTPLIASALGSTIDHILNALYFSNDTHQHTLPWKQFTDARLHDHCHAVPLLTGASYHNLPLIGTSRDYFTLRQLSLQTGTWPLFHGETVVGANCATTLQLTIGDKITCDSNNSFRLATAQPLTLLVTGILEEAHSADDTALFVDIHTSWIIAGLGHGHKASTAQADPALIMDDTLNPSSQNRFHFHGHTENFPLSAILLFPETEKAATLLSARYQSDSQLQIYQPFSEITQLLTIFSPFTIVIALSLVLTALICAVLFVLIFSLTVQMRRSERHSFFILGCSTAFVIRLYATELSLLLLAALICALSVTAFCWSLAPRIEGLI